VSSAAACGFLILATRWFDDVQDRDRPHTLVGDLGPARATNFAAGALTVAWHTLASDRALPQKALEAFGRWTIDIARGQDADLTGRAWTTLAEYWRLMGGKTGSALALACEVGALVARPDRGELAATCGRIGMHMGMSMQILDDLDGAFHPDGIGDLARGLVTLPVLYGLMADHPAREELRHIVSEGRLAASAPRVRARLEEIQCREFLVWCAFAERRRAYAAIAELPPARTDQERCGRDTLSSFADMLLVGWEDLVGPSFSHLGSAPGSTVPEIE
jgi:geranylgeranyl pyrophosphate synthase